MEQVNREVSVSMPSELPAGLDWEAVKVWKSVVDTDCGDICWGTALMRFPCSRVGCVD